MYALFQRYFPKYDKSRQHLSSLSPGMNGLKFCLFNILTPNRTTCLIVIKHCKKKSFLSSPKKLKLSNFSFYEQMISYAKYTNVIILFYLFIYSPFFAQIIISHRLAEKMWTFLCWAQDALLLLNQSIPAQSLSPQNNWLSYRR